MPNVAPSAVIVDKLRSAYELSGNVQGAVSIIESWQDDNPDDLQLDLLLAGLYMRQNDYENAINYYNKVLLNNPDNLVALNNLSWLYIGTSLDRAYELAEKANSLRPNDPGIMDTLGWILIKQGNIEQGQSLLTKALALLPNSPDIRYHYAFSLAQEGNEQAAVNELSRILNDGTNFMERQAAEELMNLLR